MFLEKEANPTKEPVDRRLSEGIQPDRIKSRPRIGNAHFLSFVSRPEMGTRLEQDLCRDAPLMQTGPAKFPRIKDKDSHADF
jgi:hypothetical protein